MDKLTKAPLLNVKDLRVQFSGAGGIIHAIRGLDLTICAGETVGLVGESGSGKSTVALAILGLLSKRQARMTAQAVNFNGHDLLYLDERELREIRGDQISVVFQDPLSSLNPLIPIGRQITETLTAHHPASSRVAKARALELLDLVGIPHPDRVWRSYPHQFSGGMRQRVMIAMALTCSPQLLIADEPTTALDVTIQAQILDLLKRLRAELSMAVLLITHDLGVVADFADRITVMHAGVVVESGPTVSVLRAPRHPYTQGLIRSIPRIDQPRGKVVTGIDGPPPSPAAQVMGCSFQPRCPYAVDRCVDEEPSLESVGEDWAVACWVKPPTVRSSDLTFVEEASRYE